MRVVYRKYTPGENLPRNLCLSQHHATSKKNRRPKVTFDIDSICCFPPSLAIARRGIKWLPKFHASQNITADIHFSLRVSAYIERGVPSSRYDPLHNIPHYCFGFLIGMEAVSRVAMSIRTSSAPGTSNCGMMAS